MQRGISSCTNQIVLLLINNMIKWIHYFVVSITFLTPCISSKVITVTLVFSPCAGEMSQRDFQKMFLKLAKQMSPQYYKELVQEESEQALRDFNHTWSSLPGQSWVDFL